MTYSQSEALAKFEPDKIPSTSDFPIDLMEAHMPDPVYQNMAGVEVHSGRGQLLNMGSGANVDKMIELQTHHFTPWAVDINVAAIADLQNRRLFADVGDAQEFGSGELFYTAIMHLELFQGVLFQALLPSLLGDSWKSVIESADVALHPKGKLFIADYLAADEVYPELFSEQYPEPMWRENAARWRERYLTSFLTFHDLPIPYHTFAVGLPGQTKERYDWRNDTERLRFSFDHRDDPKYPRLFERFSQHTDSRALEAFMQDSMGYTLREKRLVPRPSRVAGVVSPGVLWVYEKPSQFRYQPWRAGLSMDDPMAYDIAKERKGSPWRRDFDYEYFERLLHNLPPSQRRAFEKWRQFTGSTTLPPET